MNDRFKFRFWNKTRKIMETFNNSPLTLGGLLLGKNDNYEILSCTGLKDKNGKLIYEGDILKGKKDMICSPHSSRMVDKVGVVEILQNMFVASCRDVKNNCTLFCQNDWVKTEVIGNIYENPELIERI